MFFRISIIIFLFYFVSCSIEPTSSIKKGNTSPLASFTIEPDSGDTSTLFKFNASSTSDNQDSTSSIEVRWDWENDGIWDTEYSTTKLKNHKFQTNGLKYISLEVKDTDGLLDTTTNYVNVSSSIGDYFPLVIGNIWTYSFYDEEWVGNGSAYYTKEGVGSIELYSVMPEVNEIKYYLKYKLNGEQIDKKYNVDLGVYFSDTTSIFINDTLLFIEDSDHNLYKASSGFFSFNLPRYTNDGIDTLIYGGNQFESTHVMVKDIGIIYFNDYGYTKEYGFEKKWILMGYDLK